MDNKVLRAFFPIITVILICCGVIFSMFAPGLVFNGLLLILAANITMTLTVATNKSPVSALLFVGLFIASAIVFRSLATSLLIFVLFLPIGLATGLVIKKKGAVNSSVFISVIAVLLSGICAFCAYVYETNSSFSIPKAVEPIQEQLKASTDDIAKLYCTKNKNGKSAYELITNKTLTDAELSDCAKDISTQAYESTLVGIPIVIGEGILLTALICYYVAKSVLKKSLNGEGTAFSDIRVSKTGAAITVLCLFVNFFATLTLSDMSPTTALLNTPWLFTLNIFATLMNSVLAVAGISVITHIVKKVNLPKKNKMTLLVFTVVGFLLFGINIFSIVGTADSFFDFRRKYEAISK